MTECLSKKNWKPLFQRYKGRFGEIDLIFSKENKILLVEVKTLNNSWRSFQRIEPKQVERLLRNKLFWTMKFRELQFEACVAWVAGPEEISFVELN